MQIFWVLLAASAFAIASCDEDDNSAPLLDPRDMDAIQDKLARMDFLEQIVGEVFGFKKTEEREDTCLPVGAECHFWSGPNCCGLRTRCIVWDTQLPATKTKSSATWISKCRDYKLGVWLDDIGSWFASLGK